MKRGEKLPANYSKALMPHSLGVVALRYRNADKFSLEKRRAASATTL